MLNFKRWAPALVMSALVAASCGGGAESPESAATPANGTEPAAADAGGALPVETTVAAATTLATPSRLLRVAVITPSAEDDLAFSQSMYDAVARIAEERGPEFIEVAKSPGVFDTAAALEVIRFYAEEGYDLIIAHGSQFGPMVKVVASEHPTVSFAWGTAADTFGLDNVFAMEAHSDEGGYVLGTLAAALTTSGTIGAVGPIEVGDAKLYIDGFRKGVLDRRADAVLEVGYTGSFTDTELFGTMTAGFLGKGADVMTGSSQAVVGAVPLVEKEGALWFGTQSNQTALSPTATVASQVYHWEVPLRAIISSIETGDLGGEAFDLTLANQGLQIEFNPQFSMSAEREAIANATIQAVIGDLVATLPES